jgi:hypothetical protein
MRKIGWLFLAGLLAGLLAACAPQDEITVELAPLSTLSEELQQAPVHIQEAYRFAVANPELLQQIPCYCGCGVVGHMSNYDCYIAGMNPDGSPQFDTHGFG